MEGADLVPLSKTNSADYHDEMNSDYYIEWLTEQLVPTLERPFVIVLDIASYHNKQKDKAPTTNDKKAKWLDKHNITYSDRDMRLDIVKQHRPSPLYWTDEVKHNMGHNVSRLSVAHWELNPIE